MAIQFTLYVAGDSPRSAEAVENLRRLVAVRFGGACEMNVVDVLTDPDRADDARILTTPTLVKEAPGTPRRVTGDLTDPDRVLAALGLTAAARGPAPESRS